MHGIVSAFHGATALLTLSMVGPDADGKKVDGLGLSRLGAGREGYDVDPHRCR